MSRPRSWLVLLFVFGVGSVCGLLVSQQAPRPARGQPIGDDIPPEQRSQMFAQLDRQVGELEKQANILKTAVRLAAPSVVHIDVEKPDNTNRPFRGRSNTVEEAGSGVVIQLGANYYVLTNRHVIKDASLSNIKVHFIDGNEVSPLRVWADQDTDVGVMQISTAYGVPARLGNSDKVEIGDFVLAMGSPFGLSHSVTYGIISQKGRRDLQLGDETVKFQDFMQTDASINPGNSGGPLISLRGEVIGINTAIASNSGTHEGVGFSIPINMAMAVARQLIEKGQVQRAFLGVNLDPKFTSVVAQRLGLPRRQGARVTSITPGSPAEGAKLIVGDVILTFDGIRVDDDAHLVNMVSLTEVGRDVPMMVLRDKQQVQLTVRVANKPAATQPPRE